MKSVLIEDRKWIRKWSILPKKWIKIWSILPKKMDQDWSILTKKMDQDWSIFPNKMDQDWSENGSGFDPFYPRKWTILGCDGCKKMDPSHPRKWIHFLVNLTQVSYFFFHMGFQAFSATYQRSPLLLHKIECLCQQNLCHSQHA